MSETLTKHEPQNLQFSAEIGKILHLVTHALYTNKDIFLRELISNAADACDKLRYESLTNPKLLEGEGAFEILLTVDKKNRTLSIRDNGIGMTRDELAENLGTIARSGTQEFLSRLKGDSKNDLELIGQFGVGFYASFMVAGRVIVQSRKAGEKEGWQWESEGTGSFTLAPAASAPGRGTEITLFLRDGEDEYLDRFRLEHIIRTYSEHIAVPIRLIDEEGASHALGGGAALWTRPKSEITEEQYQSFYREVAHTPEKPFLTLHYKAEGTVEYTALLFVPGMRPFDLFHPDRKRRVKLYVKRVFITDEGVDLIPQWLRFLRGVVDSADLPLNISRETLQKNPVLDKIRENLTKKFLAELKKKAEADSEGYAAFWQHFGPTLKEGLCEAISGKEQILDVCRFYSSASEGKLSSLEDYIGRMKPDQDTIYFLAADSLKQAEQAPQLEGFKSRGIEVLLLTDHVDDFWTSVVHEYKGKKLQSITRADSEPEESKPQMDDPLLKAVKELLGDAISEVRYSSKLTESPVALSSSGRGMEMRMERFLFEQGQIPARAPKILEVNGEHPLIQKLAAAREKDKERFEHAFWLLLDQACILAGEPVTDQVAFAKRLGDQLQQGL